MHKHPGLLLMLKKRPVRVLSALTRRYFLPPKKKISTKTEFFTHISESRTHIYEGWTHISESRTHIYEGWPHISESWTHIYEGWPHISESRPHISEYFTPLERKFSSVNITTFGTGNKNSS